MINLLLAFLGILARGAGTLVGQVLISLGIGYVTYSGLDVSLDWLKSQIAASFAAFPPEVLQILSALKVGSGLSVILSALAARMALDGVTSGSVRKMVQK